jgi:ribonuclease-3
VRGFLAIIKYLFYPDKVFLKKIKKITGFLPRNPDFYELALTHKSAPLSVNKRALSNNERLEFLGDTVLDLVVSSYLFNKFPNADEGFLTQVRSKIVNGKQLSELAKQIKLHKLIHSNTGKNAPGRIYEDAFEALVGAVYLDCGYVAAEKFVSKQIIEKHIDINALISKETNFKSKLIEWAQKYKLEIEFYTDYESVDSKIFISYLRIGNKTIGEGKGVSKKTAEQNAAKAALLKLETEQFTANDF